MSKASVIIAFYKRIDFLRLTLAGFGRQSFKDFEVIIADDGSPTEVVKEIEKLLNELPIPAIHVWQEDKGFRKNRILNRALLSSQSEYLIFVDGDCIPHSKFVEEYLLGAKRNVALTGRRVNLSKKITDMLTPELVLQGFLETKFGKLIIDGLFGKSYDVEKGFYFKSNFLRKFFNSKKRGLLGCNFSIYKKDLLAINGFDERYEAPSIGEDSDVQFRLELNGVEIKSLNNIAVQYHLFHDMLERSKTNLALFEQVKKSKEAITKFGALKKL